MYYKLFFILLISVIQLNATILIKDISKKTSILENSSYFVDSSSLSFEEIKNKKFEQTKTNYLRLGYTDTTLWIKFSIRNTSNKHISRFITVSNPMLDVIELYTIEGDSYKREEQGISNLDKYNRNNILHPSFQVEFMPYEKKYFYYKSYSISSANYLKLYIQNRDELYEDEFAYQIKETLFFGAMGALLVYNIFIFIFTRQIAYLYYSLFLFFVTMNHLSYTVMIDYLIGEEYSYVEAFFAVYYLSLSIIFSLLFITNILDIHRYKRLRRITYILIFINFVIGILSVWFTFILEYSVIAMYLSIFYIIYLSIFSFIKKHAIAKYILVAWGINIVGLFSLGFVQFGIPNPIDYYPYFYELTSFLEAILFSIALASKLNKTKDLEISFKKNNILIEELNHRVKNNMNLIIAIYRMKLEKTMSIETEQKINEIESIVISMSQIHDYLYNQKKLENINTSEYFQDLSKKLSSSYNTEKISLSMDIQIELNLEKSIYLGQIINELITNSIKYAFKEESGQINITLKKIDNKILLLYTDNGIGFNYEKEKDESFGLYFINTIVQNELKGNISFDCLNHTSITITL